MFKTNSGPDQMHEFSATAEHAVILVSRLIRINGELLSILSI